MSSEHSVKTQTGQPCSLFVFQNDLRVADHPLLIEACESSEQILFLYCLQPWMFTSGWLADQGMGQARHAFLMQSLLDLDQQLRQQGHRLHLIAGELAEVVSDLHQQHPLTHLFISQVAGVFEQQQVSQIQTRCPDIKVATASTGYLWNPNQLPFDLSELPKHFTPFRKKVEQIPVDAPYKQPTHWPAPIQLAEHNNHVPIEAKTSSSMQTGFVGGSTAGLKHLGSYFSSTLPANYKNVRNQLDGWEHSTKFSPWLALGCVSPRQIMQYLKTYETEQVANESTYWIYFELMWREFFHWNALKVGQRLYLGQSAFAEPAEANTTFQQWSEGRTGQQLIDACMRQLNQTGFMSNRGRQIVASYLIHETNADWQAGASYFERMLIDYDVASNWGNWQYIAGVGADPRGGRYFNVEKQQRTHDPTGSFRQAWQEVDAEPAVIDFPGLA